MHIGVVAQPRQQAAQGGMAKVQELQAALTEKQTQAQLDMHVAQAKARKEAKVARHVIIQRKANVYNSCQAGRGKLCFLSRLFY